MISMNVGGDQGGRLLHSSCSGRGESTSGWRCYLKEWFRDSWVFGRRNDLGNDGMMLRGDVLLAHLVVWLQEVLMRQDTCRDPSANQDLTTTSV